VVVEGQQKVKPGNQVDPMPFHPAPPDPTRGRAN
jgi:hypothetical protein